MYLLAEELGVLRISEIEELSVRELLEWAAWLTVKHEKPAQSAEQMQRALRMAGARPNG